MMLRANTRLRYCLKVVCSHVTLHYSMQTHQETSNIRNVCQVHSVGCVTFHQFSLLSSLQYIWSLRFQLTHFY